MESACSICMSGSERRSGERTTAIGRSMDARPGTQPVTSTPSSAASWTARPIPPTDLAARVGVHVRIVVRWSSRNRWRYRRSGSMALPWVKSKCHVIHALPYKGNRVSATHLVLYWNVAGQPNSSASAVDAASTVAGIRIVARSRL